MLRKAVILIPPVMNIAGRRAHHENVQIALQLFDFTEVAWPQGHRLFR
jgi:hypothetical protein